MPDVFPPFPGFRSEAFTFLRELAAHNERPWFKARKAIYQDELVWPLRCLMADFAREADRLGLPVTADPKRSLFRIYRDTRFSKNKTPYKTHLGAVLSRSGGRKDPGGVYVHVQPGASFVAAGFWNPDSALLRAWRTRMTDDPDAFFALLDRLDEHGLELGDGPSLKRMPRGFEAYADAQIAPYLKRKRFTVHRDIDDADLTDPGFTARLVAHTRRFLPLLEYGWPVVDTLRDD